MNRPLTMFSLAVGLPLLFVFAGGPLILHTQQAGPPPVASPVTAPAPVTGQNAEAPAKSDVSPVQTQPGQTIYHRVPVPGLKVLPPVPTPAQTAPPAGIASSAQAFTITDTVDLVLLDVSVRNRKGGSVSGLPEQDFTVLENGVPQKITQFADNDIPVTVGLIVDNSGSMAPKKPEVIVAALVFIEASNPQDEVFVINFNDTVRRGLPDLVPFTDNIQMLRRALLMTDPKGRTALYDAIMAGLHQLTMGRRDKKTLVVISDGGDNVSTHTLKQVLDAVRASRATIYTVGTFDQLDPDRNPGVLRKLAEISGGEYFNAEDLQQVIPICRKIAQDIRTRYTIGYIPQDLQRKGVRHIKVLVRAPDHGKLIARTRTEYVVGNPATTEADRR
jgi:Ca-activated chloride channel homolog